MPAKATGRQPTGGRRFLRGVRTQLLLWTILPLAVVLIVLSLAGVARHRQAMTRLVEDRDRGVTIAEANRLGREVAQQTALLTRLAAALPVTTPLTTLSDPSQEVGSSYAGGLALLDGQGALRAASPNGSVWAGSDTARLLAARTAALGQAQYETDLRAGDAARLFVGVPASPGLVLIGALPVEALSLVESNLLMEGEMQGAMFVLDQTGRRVHHHDPSGLDVDSTVLGNLPRTGAGSTYLRDQKGRELLVSYAHVEPPGWTLVTAEDVRTFASMGVSAVEALPLLLLFVAVVALLAVSLGVLNIVRPLQELDRRAARVAWGDFDAVEQSVGGVQEIDDLRVTLAQMAARIRSYQSGMRDYLSAITQGQEEERTRLAHELHDVTIQGLVALKQRGQMARKAVAHDPQRAEQRLDELNGLIDDEMASLRHLIGDLRPIYLEDLGFVPALEMLPRQMQERYGLSLHLMVHGDAVRLTHDVELAAYRIVQQALANVAAHAQARNVWLDVTFTSEYLTLVIRDDGRGFIPPDQPADLVHQGHFGLMGMRERALLYGGQLTITSSPGQGAAITAQLPLFRG